MLDLFVIKTCLDSAVYSSFVSFFFVITAMFLAFFFDKLIKFI